MRISDWSSDVCSSDLGRDQPDGLRQLEKEVCRPDAVGDAAPARAGAGEWAAEEDRGRLFVGQRDAAGRDQAKALRPGRKRAQVDAMQSEWANSNRRACAVILLDPKVYRYTSHRHDLAAMEPRIKEICQTRLDRTRTRLNSSH